MINDTIVVLQERMAGYLMFCRFHKIDEKSDLKDSNRRIYVFKDTPEIRAAMSKYHQYKDLVI